MKYFTILSVVLGLAQSASIATSSKSQAPAPPKRSNIATLDQNQRQAYFSAVRTLFTGANKPDWTSFKANFIAKSVAKFPTKDPEGYPGIFDHYREEARNEYFVDYFYLKEVEKLLREIDSTVAIPYWDFTAHATNPKEDKVFSAGQFGSKVDANGCLTDGQFKDFNNNCLKRRPISNNDKLVTKSEFDELMQIDGGYKPGVGLKAILKKVDDFLGDEFKNDGEFTDPLQLSISSFKIKVMREWHLAHTFAEDSSNIDMLNEFRKIQNYQ